MHLRSMAAAAVLLLLFAAAAQAHNITKILDHSPEFSVFNRYLTITDLADDINRRETITVCVVNNSVMSDLLSKRLSTDSLKNVLGFHVLLDYFDSEKLHDLANGTALASTVFQASGSAPGSSGLVNITDLKGGLVSFGTNDNGGKMDAVYVKSVKEIPYNISVIQISNVITSPDAEAPVPPKVGMNLTSVMSEGGCKFFAETLQASAQAEKAFSENVESGLTVFCPGDDAFKKFLPAFKKLGEDDQQSLLEYHGTSVFLTMENLKSSDGALNTLATNGANKFDFEVKDDDGGDGVTLNTKVMTARITGTLVEEQPVAVYKIDNVLLPREIFKRNLAPTPAPSPSTGRVANAPKHHSPTSAPSPAASPDDDQADDVDSDTNENSGYRFGGATRFIYGVLGFWFFSFIMI